MPCRGSGVARRFGGTGGAVTYARLVPTSTDLVIFDCDGVLVDSERLAIELDIASIRELGWEITETEVLENFLGRA